MIDNQINLLFITGRISMFDKQQETLPSQQHLRKCRKYIIKEWVPPNGQIQKDTLGLQSKLRGPSSSVWQNKTSTIFSCFPIRLAAPDKASIHCPANQSPHSCWNLSMTRFIWPGPVALISSLPLTTSWVRKRSQPARSKVCHVSSLRDSATSLLENKTSGPVHTDRVSWLDPLVDPNYSGCESVWLRGQFPLCFSHLCIYSFLLLHF